MAQPKVILQLYPMFPSDGYMAAAWHDTAASMALPESVVWTVLVLLSLPPQAMSGRQTKEAMENCLRMDNLGL